MDYTACVKFEYRCKVCQLSRTHPEMFKQLHELHLEQDVSQVQTMKIINARAEELGIPDWRPLNAMNLSGHFRSHIALDEHTVRALVVHRPFGQPGPQPRPMLSGIAPEAGEYVDSLVHQRIGTELRDHDRLERIYEDLSDKVVMLSDYITELKDKSEEPGNECKSPFDIDVLMAYQKLIAESRAVVNDLNKIRQSGKLVSMAIESLLHKMLMEMIRRMTEIYNSHSDELVNIGVDESKALKMVSSMRVQTAEMMSEVARAAVAEVLKEYKISKKV